MDLRRALGIFRMDGRVSMEQLNSSFRDLVKKYHPDKVRGYPEWAHERMAEINAAYERLTEWIATPRRSLKKGPAAYSREDENRNSYDDILRRETSSLSTMEEKIFYPPFNKFLDGLGLYYQYGLESAKNREEGVRRFRYREALRSIENAKESLKNVARQTSHPAIEEAARFARITLADMNTGNPLFPPGPPGVQAMDRRFRQARHDLDIAMKEIFFPEMLPTHLHGRISVLLYSCYGEFTVFLSLFPTGERQKAGILQTARYDSLMNLLEFRNENIIHF